MTVRSYVCFVALLFTMPYGTGAVADTPLLSGEKAISLPFASKADIDRSYADFPVEAPESIAKADSFQVDLECDHPMAMGHFTLYFRSENGWYNYSPVRRDIAWNEPERVSLTFSRTVFQTEGNPGPLDRADMMRFSVWRGKAVDTTLRLKNIETKFFSVLSLIPDRDEDIQAQKALETRMRRAGIPFGTLRQDELTEDRLKTTKIVVLPNHPGLSPETVSILERFVEQGGKLIAFYQLPVALSNILGFQRGQYVASPKGDEALAGFRFEKIASGDDPFANLPEVEQRSWNIITASPLKGSAAHGARTAAFWYDAAGRKTTYPALLLSDRGAYFSHILTNDDPENKDRFLLALFGHFDPSFLHQSSVRAWQRLFSVGDYRSRSPAQLGDLEKGFLAELKKRGFDLDAAFFGRKHDPKLIRSIAPRIGALNDALREIRQEAVERYCRCVPAKTPEFRAWWEHAGLGAYPGDWDRTMRELSENGFNAIISNLLWGGSAHYASDVLPRSQKFETYGDQVEQAINAGKKYGVEVHAWQVCYRLSGSPPEFIETMKKAGRTQKNGNGVVGDWLCPSHPENIDLECETFCELVRKYPDLTGIHYDYIRYPDLDHCYCEGCRDRFSETTGSTVADWPKDVLKRGELQEKYLQWRRDNITRLVERVHRETKKIRPSIKISAAVFPDYPSCRNSIGQDWPLWVEKGYLDFICPMDYTANLDLFDSMVAKQTKLVAGRIPLYPGIGATATNVSMNADCVAVEIGIAREHGAPGFVIFNLLKGTIESIVPLLGEGPTKPVD